MLKRSLPWNINLAPDAEGGGGEEDANTAAASSAAETETEVSEDQTLEDVVQEAAESHSAEETEEESGSTNEPDKGEKGKEGEEEESGTPPTKEKPKVVLDEGDEKLPFHAHPRFQEVITERNTLRDQVAQAEAAKPLVEQQQSIVNFCQQNNISPQQFQEGLAFIALMNNNPQEFRQRFAPVWDKLAEFDGSRLPKDLEDKVAAGSLTIEDANEIAQLRAQSKNGELRGRLSAEQQKQVAFQSEMQALGSWQETTMKSDPDFQPKAKEDAPDGKYELVTQIFTGLLATNRVNGPQDVVKLAQRAYDNVSKTWKSRLTPKAPTRKVIPSSKSAATKTTKEPETLDEAVAMAARAHGIEV